jgi:hypothetical protein
MLVSRFKLMTAIVGIVMVLFGEIVAALKVSKVSRAFKDFKVIKAFKVFKAI